MNDYVCTLLLLYVIEFADIILYNLCTGGIHVCNIPEGMYCTVYAPKRTTMNIYIICPVHSSFIGCGDRVDTTLTGTHQSLYCTCVVCTVLLSVTSFMRRGLQCLITEWGSVWAGHYMEVSFLEDWSPLHKFCTCTPYYTICTIKLWMQILAGHYSKSCKSKNTECMQNMANKETVFHDSQHMRSFLFLAFVNTGKPFKESFQQLNKLAKHEQQRRVLW